nr:MAG TPA: Protein A6 VIRUS, A6, POXVIRUSES, VIRION.6A [Caudoviricetes sp.]
MCNFRMMKYCRYKFFYIIISFKPLKEFIF